MSKTTLIKIEDTGKPYYTLSVSDFILGRRYDNNADMIEVVIPETERDNTCVMMISDINGNLIDHIIMDTNIKPIRDNVSQYESVRLSFYFMNFDNYIKNSQIKTFSFLEGQMPADFTPSTPIQNENVDYLIQYGFTNSQLNGNTLEFYNMNGELVKSFDFSPFMQEQSDLAETDSTQETFVKNKSTKYLANEGSDGTDTYAEMGDVIEKVGDLQEDLTDGTITVKKAEQDAQGNVITDTYVPKTRTVNGKALSSDVVLEKGDVGLANVTNDLQVKASEKGVANGVASLDENVKIPISQLPDFILGQVLYGGNVSSGAVATLSANAKSKLGTSNDTITLTNDTTAITGYEANDGIYYIATANFSFAGLTILTGDWLISRGNGWGKIDNTDAVTGVKGNAENAYRIGNVEITPDNLDDTNTTNKFVTASDKQAWNAKEDTSNKVTSIDSNSTNAQYPSAKAVYDAAIKSGIIQLTGTEEKPINFATDLVVGQLYSLIGNIRLSANSLLSAAGNMLVYKISSTKLKTFNCYFTTNGARSSTGITGENDINSTTGYITSSNRYFSISTLNGYNSFVDSVSIYAPTSSGTSGYILQSNGANNAPTYALQKVTSISNSSTDSQIPTAKAIYDYIASLNGTQEAY